MSNTDRPLVTIGIPTYNRADGTLTHALTCAISQTYPALEIIVSDNCSTDRTEAVVKQFSDPRIRYFKQARNIGANNNFNFCVARARGAYFLLLHDDDLIDDDFVKTCLDAANDDTSVGIIRTGMRIINDDGAVLIELPNRAQRLSTTELLLAWFTNKPGNKVPLYLCNTLFNTKGLQEIGGFRSRHSLFQDVATEVRLAVKYGRIDAYAVKASFREHANNMGSRARISDWCEDSLYLLDTICELMPENKDLLKRKGMPFLCKMNYTYVNKFVPPTQRFFTYLVVAKKFNLSYSPFTYVYHKELKPRLQSLRRRVKELFSSTPAT